MAAFLIPAFYPVPVATIDSLMEMTLHLQKLQPFEWPSYSAPQLQVPHSPLEIQLMGSCWPSQTTLPIMPMMWHASSNQKNFQQSEELHDYAQSYFNLYAVAYAALMAAIIGRQAPPAPPAPAPAPAPATCHAPKLKMPDKFNGKSTTEAWHFLQQCHNYLVE